MKYKIGFKMDWLEMILILVIVFLAGLFVGSKMDDKVIIVGLLIVGAAGYLVKKRVKMPVKDSKQL